MSTERQDSSTQQGRRIVVVLSSREAREALGFFRQEFEVEGNNLTIEDVLRNAKTKEGKRLADALTESGKVKPTFGMFLGGTNIECLDGLKTRIDDHTNIVVIELMSRIAGG